MPADNSTDLSSVSRRNTIISKSSSEQHARSRANTKGDINNLNSTLPENSSTSQENDRNNSISSPNNTSNSQQQGENEKLPTSPVNSASNSKKGVEGDEVQVNSTSHSGYGVFCLKSMFCLRRDEENSENGDFRTIPIRLFGQDQ